MLAVEWSQGFENAWSSVAEFVPKFLAFLAILIIGWIIAKAIAKAIGAVLERVGFDRAVERGGVKKALDSTKYDASDIVGKIVYYALLLIVLQLAFGMWGPNPVSDLIQGIISYLPQVIAAIIIIVVASAIGAAVREVIDASLGGLSYGKALGNAAGIAILTIGIFAALDQLNIAPAIVTGLFYAVLAVVAGSLIIAIGSGGIAPMRSRWEAMLNKYDEEKPRMQNELDGAQDRIQQRAEQRKSQAQRAANSPDTKVVRRRS